MLSKDHLSNTLFYQTHILHNQIWAKLAIFCGYHISHNFFHTSEYLSKISQRNVNILMEKLTLASFKFHHTTWVAAYLSCRSPLSRLFGKSTKVVTQARLACRRRWLKPARPSEQHGYSVSQWAQVITRLRSAVTIELHHLGNPIKDALHPLDN